MKGFARVTKLSNVSGRADYISNPDRQESIVAASEPVDWKPYHDYEMANQKTAARNNEGREVVIALPNEWAALSRDELTRRAEKLAVTAAGKSTDMQWAVHWNKAHTNLHIHVIFSERQREKEPGRWDRDIYLTDEGKVARRKADRARNEDGSFKPPVHRKGDLKDGFTAKDPKYVSRGWVPAMKQQLREQFAALGVELEKPQPLHEYHEGKGKEAPAIRAKNEAIRENNANYAGWRAAFPQLKERSLKQLMVKAAKAGKVLYIGQQPDGRLGYGMTTVKEWRAAAAKEQEAASTHVDPPQRSVSFAALGEAAREYYRETFALHDTRRPLSSAVQKAPADLQAAFAELQEARSRASAASFELSRCHFWERDKKRAARSKLYAAEQECRAAFDTVVSYGISRYQDGAEQSGMTVDLEQLQGRVAWQVKDLQGKADYEARFARPADALQGSPERQKAAQERFEQLCREIPPESRKAAREAINAALTASDRGGGMAAAKAIEALQKTTNKLLPEQRDQTRSREQGRSR